MMKTCFFYILKTRLFYIAEMVKDKKSRFNFRQFSK